jgi:hypothetical protein
MAARRLGEIPDVPQEYLNPLQPALAASLEKVAGRASQSGLTSLDLK